MKKRIITMVLGTVLAIGLLSGCGNPQSANKTITSVEDVPAATSDGTDVVPEQTAADSKDDLNQAREIRIGTNNNYFTATVAYQKGFLQDEFGDGFKISLHNFTNGPQQIEAIAAGELDIVQYGDVPTTNSYANNAGVHVISNLWSSDDAYALLAGPDSGISQPSDLKGKTVAIGIGTNNHQFLLKVLEAGGLTEADINILNISSGSDQLASLIEGSVDAITTTQPNFDSYAEKSGGKIIVTNKDYNLAATFILATDDFATKNPDTVARVLKVLDQTNKWIEENLDESVTIVADYFGIAEADARKYWDTRVFDIGWSDELTETLGATVEYEYAQGLIKAKFDPNDAIDTTYLELAGLHTK